MKKRIKKIIDVIRDNNLDDEWTMSFCQSILVQAARGRALSARQTEIFEKKEKEYSASKLKKIKEWSKTWETDPQVREDFLIACRYYRRTPYYSVVCSTALKTRECTTLAENYMPTYKLFKSMTTNKYAQKVLAAWKADPKYPVNSTVCLRPTAAPRSFIDCPKLRAHKSGNPVPYFIMESNASDPRSASLGSKVYRILPVGESISYLVEERALKKYRKKRR